MEWKRYSNLNILISVWMEAFTMPEFNLILDYYELLNLHKTLLEAKFHTNPENELVAGSPFVANIYIQVRDLLIQSEKGNQWKDWFQLSNRQDRKNQAIFMMKNDKRWGSATIDEKSRIASNYLAPFIFDDEELKNIVAEIDHSFIEGESFYVY